MRVTARSNSTANANAVYAALKTAGRALSAYQILALLRGTSIKAPVQVYRALQQLQDSGAVHRIHSLNAFIACSTRHHDNGRSGLMICSQCHAVSEFEDPDMESLPERLGALGFRPQNVVLEVAGLCADCQSEAVVA